MKRHSTGSEILLLLASVIWGFAFVAQRAGMEHVGPFIFNAVRFALGAAALVPFTVSSINRDREKPSPLVYLYGVIAGTILFLGASLQQIGLVSTTAGKAGFITGLYVVLVPVMGIVIGQRTGKETWAGITLAAAGLYLLSFRGDFSIARGDLLVLAGTFFWAAHVLLIGSVARGANSLLLALTQFLTCSVLSFAAAALFETVEASGLAKAAIPILYGGLLSVGIAYTLQVIAQKKIPSSHAAIILSLETVFAALGGWLVLGETIPVRGLIGCTLILAGIIVSQAGVGKDHGTGYGLDPGGDGEKSV
ncbi:MAG: DMT family transporter [Candidatus Krumholzibacteriota bacterium]|nr:DMT family transporter [Candidatus Krumholzibacteriota bacterium]